MILYDYITHFFNSYLQVHSIKDSIEILFFIFCIFKISTWLNKDHTKPLLLYFYSYFVVLFGSHFSQMNTVYYITLASAPIFFTLLIIHHQKNLQKNFVLSQQTSLNPTKIYHKQWLEILVRGCLVASHHKKNITCIIQQQDNLDSLLDKQFTLNVTIQKHIIDMLLESAAYNDNKLVWVNKEGNLISVNASWSDLVINELIFDQVSEEKLPQEYAKVATNKTDAIILHINTQQQFNFVAYQGKIVENITVDQSIKLIKQFLYKKSSSISMEGSIHAKNEHSSISSSNKN